MGTFRVCAAQVTVAYRGALINLERWALMEDFVLAEVFVNREDADAALRVAQAELEGGSYSFICGRCADGDHRSHDDHEGFGGWDMLDCKNLNGDGSEQCMCRATRPSDNLEVDHA